MRLPSRMSTLLVALAVSWAWAEGASQEAQDVTVESVQALEAELAAPTAEDNANLAKALSELEVLKGLKGDLARLRATVDGAPETLRALREDRDLVDTSPSQPPQLPSGLPLEDLERRLASARVALETARSAVTRVDGRMEARKTRREELPQEVIATEEALAQAVEALQVAPPESTSVTERVVLEARVQRLGAQLEARRAEQAANESMAEILPLQRDAALRRRKQQAATVQVLEQAVRRARDLDAVATKSSASAEREAIVQAFPTLAPVAEENDRLAGRRIGLRSLPASLAASTALKESARALLEETELRRFSAARRIATGALTEGMATKLRRDFEWLESDTELGEAERELEERLTQAELEEIELVESRISDPQEAASRLAQEVGEAAEAPGWRAKAVQLFQRQSQAQELAMLDLDQITTTLYAARSLQAQARSAVEGYRSFIEERIVWVRSASKNPLKIVTGLPEALMGIAGAISSPAAGGAPALGDESDLGLERPLLPPRAGLVGALASMLLFLRRFIGRRLLEMGEGTRSYRTDRLLWTLRALVQSVLLALPAPLFMWATGAALADSPMDLRRALGTALWELSWFFGALRFLSVILRHGGLAAVHFRWRTESIEHIRRHLRWFEPAALGFALVALTLDRQGIQPWSDSLGRLAFILWMALAAGFVRATVGQKSPLWESKKSDDEAGLLLRTRRVWVFVSALLPLGLGAMALLGYYYTALQFEQRIRLSGYFLLWLLVVYSLLLRWLHITRRRLAVAKALEAKEKRKRKSEGKGDSAAAAAALDLDRVDIPAINASTRQLFKSSMTLATVLGLFLIWTSALPALQQLDRVQLFPSLKVLKDTKEDARDGPSLAVSKEASRESSGEVSGAPLLPGVPAPSPEGPESGTEAAETGLPASLTLGDVLLALIFIALTRVAVRNLPALLELALLQRLPLDAGARYAITTIVRYVILIIGVSAISGAVGVGWRQIQWLAAALTFGLAFGLQEIFANFVSGLIILIERPVRVGDIVTVGGTEGRITELRMRATTLMDWDRREYLIPNKEFITGSVINWTLTDPITRIIIPVGVAYGSDTDKARQLLIEAARNHKLVAKDPEPSAIFRRFGDSTLDFDLRVFIANRDLWPVVMDELHSQIDKAFRREGIEIAFPQREVWIRQRPGDKESEPDTSPTS